MARRMTVEALLETFKVCGIRLRLAKSGVQFADPNGLMDGRLLQELKRNKTPLTWLLEGRKVFNVEVVEGAGTTWLVETSNVRPGWSRARCVKRSPVGQAGSFMTEIREAPEDGHHKRDLRDSISPSSGALRFP